MLKINLINQIIYNLQINASQSSVEQEKIIDKELINSKDLSKENSTSKKENDNLDQLNSKEKNIITVDLTNEEKLFSVN